MDGILQALSCSSFQDKVLKKYFIDLFGLTTCHKYKPLQQSRINNLIHKIYRNDEVQIKISSVKNNITVIKHIIVACSDDGRILLFSNDQLQEITISKLANLLYN